MISGKYMHTQLGIFDIRRMYIHIVLAKLLYGTLVWDAEATISY